MKKPRILEAARREANLATVWYAEIERQLGRSFGDELLIAIEKAAKWPLRHPAYLHGTRRVLLKRFPYLVVFLVLEEEIVVIAVAHARRIPGYWVQRVKQSPQ